MANETKIDIDYVTKLSRIALSDAEKETFGAQLVSIIGYIEKLDELDTDDVEPTAHPHSVMNVWQEDQVKTEMSVENALRNAPERRNGQFVVPKIVE